MIHSIDSKPFEVIIKFWTKILLIVINCHKLWTLVVYGMLWDLLSFPNPTLMSTINLLVIWHQISSPNIRNRHTFGPINNTSNGSTESSVNWNSCRLWRKGRLRHKVVPNKCAKNLNEFQLIFESFYLYLLSFF